MNENTKSISDILKEATKEKAAELYSVVGTVDRVDQAERSVVVTPIDGGAKIYGVRLNAVFGGDKGLAMIPAEGSFVVVTFLNPLTGFVSICSDLDRVEIDCEDVVFNKGTNEGLVIVGALVDKINQLEEKVNQLQSDYKTHVHTDPISGTTGKLLVPFTGTPIAPTTTKQDIENTKIKH